MEKLMKVKPSVAADDLAAYWASYNDCQPGVDKYSEQTFIDDALYGIGIAINPKRFEAAQGYDDFKRVLFDRLKQEFEQAANSGE